MTELKLYKFIHEYEIEIDWRGDSLYIWIPFYVLNEFTNLLGYDHFSEGGEEVNLQYNCICLDLVDICESCEIDPENILPKES